MHLPRNVIGGSLQINKWLNAAENLVARTRKEIQKQIQLSVKSQGNEITEDRV